MLGGSWGVHWGVLGRCTGVCAGGRKGGRWGCRGHLVISWRMRQCGRGGSLITGTLRQHTVTLLGSGVVYGVLGVQCAWCALSGVVRDDT